MQLTLMPVHSRSLQENEHLEELLLLGNPCAAWPGYRTYVLGTLPRLQRLARPSPSLSTGMKCRFLCRSAKAAKWSCR